ncbi:MAG: type I methionyl aminopeptidase [Candidatus Andersenbacteria bacterium]
MIRLKTKEEIAMLHEGGKILAHILDELEATVKPGATGNELEAIAQKLVSQYSVTAAFYGYRGKGHPPYPAATCISVNEAVVHGVPTEKPFEEGDLVGIDMGIVYHGLYLDSARTVAAGKLSAEAQQLLDITKESLQRGIAAAQVGNTTGHIGEAIQTYIESQGSQYGIVTQLVGHGVGYDVHEDPQVPNYGTAGEGPKLKEGLVIAIEPMVTIGDPTVETAADEWTIVTQTGGLAAHQEHTVAVTADGPLILTSS